MDIKREAGFHGRGPSDGSRLIYEGMKKGREVFSLERGSFILVSPPDIYAFQKFCVHTSCHPRSLSVRNAVS